MKQTPPTRSARAGAVLLEVTLALAVFILAAAAILSLMGQAGRTLREARRQELLVDLARSVLAQIEAGIARPETLNGPVPQWPVLAGTQAESSTAEPVSGLGGYELRINTRPTETTGIIVVEVEAVYLEPAGSGTEPAVGGRFTLRQAIAMPAMGVGGAR